MNMLNPDCVPEVVKKHPAYHSDVLRTCLIELFRSPKFDSGDFVGTQQFAMQYCVNVLLNACYNMGFLSDDSPKLFLLRDSTSQESAVLKVVTLSYLNPADRLLKNYRLYFNPLNGFWSTDTSNKTLSAKSLNDLIKAIGAEKKIIFQPCPKMQKKERSTFVSNYHNQ